MSKYVQIDGETCPAVSSNPPVVHQPQFRGSEPKPEGLYVDRSLPGLETESPKAGTPWVYLKRETHAIHSNTCLVMLSYPLV